MLQSAIRTLPSGTPAPSTRETTDAIGLVNIPAAVITVERDAEIVPQHGPTGFSNHVLSGCVRTVSLLEDGRRQVGEFLVGDLLDVDANFGAEAVTPTTLRQIKRSTLDHRAAADPVFAARLRANAVHQIRAARSHCLVLGRKTAVERVASFLLEMADRIGTAADGTVALPMGRTDIADYLALTTETVCRALTEMRHAGLISVQRHSVAIVSRAALAQAGAE